MNDWAFLVHAPPSVSCLMWVSALSQTSSYPCVQTKVPKNSGNIRGVADWLTFVQVSSSLTMDWVIIDARELNMINENRDWRTQTDFSTSACFLQPCPTVLSNFAYYPMLSLTVMRLYNFSFAWDSLLFSVNWKCSYPLPTILWIVDIFAFPSLTYFICVLVLDQILICLYFFWWLPSCPNII